MKNLYNGASLVSRLNSEEYVKYGCPVAKLKDEGKSHTGSICDARQILHMFHKDFSESGKCNFYLLEENFFSVMSYMAFQVRYMTQFSKKFLIILSNNFRREVPICKTSTI